MLECGIATAFGCSIQGEVGEARVLEIAERVVADGADSLLCADTVGYANPSFGKPTVCPASQKSSVMPTVAAHFRDTRDLSLANVTAALDVGISHFDVSVAGLGGCPLCARRKRQHQRQGLRFHAGIDGVRSGIDIDLFVG